MTTGIRPIALMIARILLITCLALASVSALSCQKNDRVVYEVTGNADSVDIKISDDGGEYEDFQEVSLPWRMEYGSFPDDYLYLYAYNRGDSGIITATIYVNGQVYKSTTSSNAFSSVVVCGTK